MLLAALLTIAGILAGLVFLFSDRAQQLHPAAPTVIPLWKLYSYINEAKKRCIGFMELMRERFGGIIAIKVPFWRHIAILTGPQYAKSFFFSKEADINEGYQVKSSFILFSIVVWSRFFIISFSINSSPPTLLDITPRW